MIFDNTRLCYSGVVALSQLEYFTNCRCNSSDVRLGPTCLSDAYIMLCTPCVKSYVIKACNLPIVIVF